MQTELPRKTLGQQYDLCGEYEHTVDAKGRMNFPAKLREKLPARFKVGKTLDSKSITVYTPESWEDICSYVDSLPPAESMKYSRRFFSCVFEVELDKTGRMPIPQKLRDYAGITEDVVVVGSGKKAEIWDRETWYSLCDDEPLMG